MRIIDLLSEDNIGTIGTTTGPVSPTPSTGTPAQDPGKTDQKTDPNVTQLDSMLKQNQINVKSTDDFLRAFTAIQQKQPLTPEQEKTLGDYAKATIAKPSLPTQMATLMKTIMSKSQAQPSASAPPVPKV